MDLNRYSAKTKEKCYSKSYIGWSKIEYSEVLGCIFLQHIKRSKLIAFLNKRNKAIPESIKVHSCLQKNGFHLLTWKSQQIQKIDTKLEESSPFSLHFHLIWTRAYMLYSWKSGTWLVLHLTVTTAEAHNPPYRYAHIHCLFNMTI